MKTERQRRLPVFLLVLFFGLLTACSGAVPGSGGGLGQQRFERTYTDYFDTVTTVILYAPSKEKADRAFQLVEEELLNYHQAFDIYRTYPGRTNMKSLNDRAGRGPVKVDSAVFELLQQAKKANRLSGGATNPALGAVIQVWKQAVLDIQSAQEKGMRADGYLPDRAELLALNEHTDFDRVILDEAAGTVELQDPAMALDVGSGSKGLAAEKTARALAESGVQSAMLSLGGNVRTLGTKADGQPWLVGVQDPKYFLPDPTETINEDGETGANGRPVAEQGAGKELLLAVKADNCAVVTSGSYMRYATFNGKVYHHIIDPISLEPEDRYDGVTIISKDSGLADSLGTALFNMSMEDGMAMAAQLDNFEVLWVKDGKLEMTPGFSDYVTELQ